MLFTVNMATVSITEFAVRPKFWWFYLVYLTLIWNALQMSTIDQVYYQSVFEMMSETCSYY